MQSLCNRGVILKLCQFRALHAMKAIVIDKPGAANLMRIEDVPVPKLTNDQVLVKVAYTAVNRADILQRLGRYPVPAGESNIMGLEVSGTVAEVGDLVKSQFNVGDKVMALLGSGGYAEYVNVSSSQVIKLPKTISLREAGAIPEAWLTAFQLLTKVASMSSGKHVLIHAGASGVGTAAIQLVNYFGGVSYATAGSVEKCNFITNLGVKYCINYKTDNFAEKIKDLTGGKGVDIILDCVGGTYLHMNVESLAMDGEWVLYGLLGGSKVEGDFLGKLLSRRGKLISSLLRNRSCSYKAELASDFSAKVLPGFVSGQLNPVIHCEFPLSEIVKAHETIESNTNIGKIIVRVDDSYPKSEL